jgi:hypothetical protein
MCSRKNKTAGLKHQSGCMTAAAFLIKHSTLNIQLSTVIMHPLANLAKLLHK